MAIRITQSMMYSDMVGQMQKNLAAYMESNEQGSTQKKINRPSDDPPRLSLSKKLWPQAVLETEIAPASTFEQQNAMSAWENQKL